MKLKSDGTRPLDEPSYPPPYYFFHHLMTVVPRAHPVLIRFIDHVINPRDKNKRNPRMKKEVVDNLEKSSHGDGPFIALSTD
jgi:hypothetical protein